MTAAKLGADIKAFVERNKWALPAITFIFGVVLGPGSLWQALDYPLHNKTVSIEEAKLITDYRDRLYNINNDVSSQSVKYIEISNRHFTNKDDYQAQNEYIASKMKLDGAIAQYNYFDAKLAVLEKRKTRPYALPFVPHNQVDIKVELKWIGK
jgi:hypothetical protein